MKCIGGRGVNIINTLTQPDSLLCSIYLDMFVQQSGMAPFATSAGKLYCHRQHFQYKYIDPLIEYVYVLDTIQTHWMWQSEDICDRCLLHLVVGEVSSKNSLNQNQTIDFDCIKSF